MTFGQGRGVWAHSASTPSLTLSPSSEHSEAIESDACEPRHGPVRADAWLPRLSDSKSFAQLSCEQTLSPSAYGLRRCGMTPQATAWPWYTPRQDPNDCWTLRPLPWGQSAPSKTKWLSSSCGHITTPDRTKFSCVTDDLGRRYVMGPTLSKGTSGKMKLCLPIDSPSEALCVKELRLPAPFANAQATSKKTIETSLRHMTFECAMSREFGGPMAVRHAYAHGIRGYAVFPLARGSLFDFARDVPPYYRAPLARTVGQSVGRTLRNMHLLGRLHLDVKEGNILVHDQPPYVSLTDFGSATPIDGTRASAQHGFHSTYCAPEALMERGFVARSTDMWSLGITLLTLLSPPSDYKPFSYASTPEGGFDLLQSRANLAELQASLRRFAHGIKFVLSSDQIVPGQPEILTAEEEALQTWLAACHTADPPLMTLIADSLLVPHYGRSSAAEFVRQLGCLAAPPHIADVDAAMAHYLAGSHLDLRRGAAYDALNQIRISAHAYEYPQQWYSPNGHDLSGHFDVCMSP